MATSDFRSPSYPPSWTAYRTYMKGIPRFFVCLFVCFFIKMTAKGCTLDYVEGLGHFLIDFGATGKHSRGEGKTWVTR